MKYIRLAVATIAIVCIAALSLHAKVKVVTTTPDLAEFVQAVGGDHVSVISINRGDRDPHYVEVRPSYMLKVRKADLLFKIGMELDLWIDPIIDGSRNSRLRIIDCSQNITALEVPTFKADARHGDLHRFGNPHYWLSPDNVPPIVETVTTALSAFDPQHADNYEANAKAYLDKLKKVRQSWEPYIKALQGKKAVFYHNSWPYFAAFSGIKVIDFVEPKPGVPPSPGHIRQLIEKIEAGRIEIIAVEPYFERRIPEMLAEKTGATVVVVSPSVGGVPETNSYIEMVEYNLRVLAGEIP